MPYFSLNAQFEKYIQKNIGCFLFLGFCIIGLLTFKAYGVSWDEVAQRTTGQINYNYIFSNDNFLLKWQDKDYGIAFELPLIFLEKIFNISDMRTVYLTRHLATHLFFLIGAYYCFKLVDLLYNNKTLASIGFLIFVLHPVLYAHSFFNSKDIPFMSMFMICFYLSAKALQRKTILSFILLGAGIGLLINIRIMGAILPVVLIGLLGLDLMRRKTYKTYLKYIVVLLTSTILVVYIVWPFLWTNPIENFSIAFSNMSNYRWFDKVLFNGQLIKASELPWYYIPEWFSITTPIFYLFMGAFGFILLARNFFKSAIENLLSEEYRMNLIFAICFFAPILAVIFLHSVLYDGWRQMYFIYPSFVMIAIYGINYLLKSKYKKIVFVFTISTFVAISATMIKYYPNQHVYFNYVKELRKPESLRKTFELDYWGTSYKQAYEYILTHDNSPIIKINVANRPGVHNVNILPIDQRKRIKLVPREEAKYFITNYRWHPQDYTEYKGMEYFAIKYSDNTVCQIFKIKQRIRQTE